MRDKLLLFLYLSTVLVYLLSLYKLLINELQFYKLALLMLLFVSCTFIIKEKLHMQKPVILFTYILWCAWSLIPSYIYLQEEYFIMTFGYLIVGALVLIYIPNILERIGIQKYLHYLIKIFYITLILAIILGSIFWSDPYVFNSLSGEYRFRLFWFYDHPNYVGLVSMILVFLITLQKEKISILLFIPITLAILANSRTALLCMLVFASLILIQKAVIKKWKERFLFGVLILYLSTASILTFIYIYSDKLNFILSNRLAIWRDFLIYEDLRFLIGNGLSYNATRLDNWFIDIFNQTGLIGLMLMLIFLVLIFYYLLTQNKVLGFKKQIIVAMFITSIIYGIAESGFLLPGGLLTIVIWPVFGWMCLNSDCYQRNQLGLDTKA